MPNNTEDRVYGCLVGGAIGDALGAIVENWSYERIHDEYGKVETFRSYDNPIATGEPGAVTDDTVMRQYLSLAIVENGGRVTPDEYADVLVEHLNPDRVWITEEITHLKLLGGLNPWESGRNTVPGGTAVMHIAPVGIINAGDPRQAYQDAFNIASITQDGVERDAAATVAAGVAEALSPETSLDEILATMYRKAPDELYRGIDLTMELAERADSIDEFVELFYDERLDWRWPAVDWDREKYHEGEIFSASSIEIVPASMAILHFCGGDVNAAIIEAASFGRDCDTLGSVVGSVCGALHGASAIRGDWIGECEDANREFFEELHGDPHAGFEEMAGWLVDALVDERDRMAERANQLDDLL